MDSFSALGTPWYNLILSTNLHCGSLLIALHRIGPYHHARFTAAAAQLELQVLETRPTSQEYPWAFDPSGHYPIYRLSGQPHPEADAPTVALDRQLHQLLDDLQPEAVVSVGWADRAYQRLLLACHSRHIPILIVSDSRQRDQPRSPAKDWIKQQLLRGYSAALVAGIESRAYLLKLGFPAAAIAQPWDVVDNHCFAATAALAATEPHFLCVSRFVAKKNHAGLLAAYGTYQRQGGAWGLQLIGTGPLEAEIRAAIAAVPDPCRVLLQPFQQIKQLSESYRVASAFVLASTSDQWGLVVNEAMAAGLPCLVSSSCGCAADLIEHGLTGWCFDPADPAALTATMHAAERQLPAQRQAMTIAAHARLEAYNPASFANGLQQALEWARDHPRRSHRAALVAALLSR
ncbi:MAG: glycosyltransferase [Cyanobium sp. CZS 48M]|nr:glycosyltransferase [Cyanobium sp. CZS48M]